MWNNFLQLDHADDAVKMEEETAKICKYMVKMENGVTKNRIVILEENIPWAESLGYILENNGEK